ncbi:hypothetical protein C5Z04_21265 [Phocaeicola vulgatus]|nr:hypothetical protein C5Z04_21265 [Phocaeicola vulgatus]
MKGEKEQPDFIAEAFKMKIISAFPPANEQMIIHVLSLIYDWYERFISFRLCNNNPNFYTQDKLYHNSCCKQKVYLQNIQMMLPATE